MAIHSKADALAAINGLSEQDWKDGIFFDVPKKRRRKQAIGEIKYIKVQLPADLQRRVACQINRYVEIFGKDLGWSMVALMLEYPTNKRLIAIAEEEGREPQ